MSALGDRLGVIGVALVDAILTGNERLREMALRELDRARVAFDEDDRG